MNAGTVSIFVTTENKWREVREEVQRRDEEVEWDALFTFIVEGWSGWDRVIYLFIYFLLSEVVYPKGNDLSKFRSGSGIKTGGVPHRRCNEPKNTESIILRLCKPGVPAVHGNHDDTAVGWWDASHLFSGFYSFLQNDFLLNKKKRKEKVFDLVMSAHLVCCIFKSRVT